MRQKLTQWAIRLTIIGVPVALVSLVAFVAPPTHDVHSPNGVAVKVQVVDTDPNVFYIPLAASQSLENVRCQLWHADTQNPNRAGPCPAAAKLAETYCPQLTQSPATLYLGWPPCGSYSAHGVSIGLNAEYVGANRTVIIHCYFARPWLLNHGPSGVDAIEPMLLLLVPTNGIPPGTLSIVQDDRVEHLIGDDTYESPLGSATIS